MYNNDDLYNDKLDEDDYDNPFNYIEPSALNSYFKHNVETSSTFNQPNNIDSNKYLNLINQVNYPILYNILSSQHSYTYTDFYSIAVKKFINFNEHELSFISKNFSPIKYEYNIFNNVIAGEETINYSQFSALLKKDFIQDFNDLYLKGVLAKYALDNFSTITKEEQSQLWQKLNLYLPQKSFIKNYFFNKSLEFNVKIYDPIFFKNTDLKNNSEMTDYFSMAVNNQWSDNLLHFSKHFPNTCFKYLQKDKDFTTKENINFERLFLYFNPSKINESNLSQENIDLVFTKIYNNMKDKNLLSKDNEKFLKTLGYGVYKFLEISHQYNEENVDDFLKTDNNFLLTNPNNNTLVNPLHILLVNIEKLNPDLQESVHKNLLYKYLPHYLSNSKSNIIYNYEENSFLFKTLVKESYITNQEKNAIIHVLLENFVSNPDSNKNTFFNKLSAFPLEALENFKSYMDFSLNILKINCTNAEESIHYVEQTFNKILLNAKLNSKLHSEVDDKKEKRLKI